MVLIILPIVAAEIIAHLFNLIGIVKNYVFCSGLDLVAMNE